MLGNIAYVLTLQRAARNRDRLDHSVDAPAPHVAQLSDHL